jgi:NAD(P)-dependent dehydrogenase (short-subunit alcohol dehydrogenase family)
VLEPYQATRNEAETCEASSAPSQLPFLIEPHNQPLIAVDAEEKLDFRQRLSSAAREQPGTGHIALPCSLSCINMCDAGSEKRFIKLATIDLFMHQTERPKDVASPPPVLLVTGGSRGIGAATTRLAARRGFSVCINYSHRQREAEALVNDICNAGGAAIAVQADISVESEVMRLFESVDKQLGRLTALVNNAGTVDRMMRLESMGAERLQRVFSLNTIGSFLCAREAVRRMSLRHGGSGGSIVNVSSGAARYGSPGEYVDYAASKAAVDTLTIGLAKEVAEDGIRVNAVRPGLIYTEIHEKSGEPGRVDRLASTIPMKRGGQPDEVATAILWLLSAEASFVSGAILDVAGGR